MRYELFLALRYLNGLKRHQPFVSVIAAISTAGVAVGVAALFIVLGVMSGFDADLESKIVGTNPHLIVQGDGGMPQDDRIIKKIESVQGVVAAAGFVQTQVLLQHDLDGVGVILRGVDPVRELRVTNLANTLKEGLWPPAHNEILIGSELARKWGLRRGDPITVIGGDKGEKFEMKVGGVFTTGMYDYDLNLSIATIPTVQKVLGWESGLSGIGVRLQDAIKAQKVKEAVRSKLGYPYWVVTWMDMNRNLFAALKLEKLAMFIILTLIVLVACFNIIATLLTLVTQKTKEVGILKSLGATNGSARRIFTYVGLLIGLLGTALGAGLGWVLCMALAKYQFIQLPAEIYYIDRLPVKMEWRDMLAVTLAAVGISWIACQYPARLASRLMPSEAVRYE